MYGRRKGTGKGKSSQPRRSYQNGAIKVKMIANMVQQRVAEGDEWSYEDFGIDGDLMMIQAVLNELDRRGMVYHGADEVPFGNETQDAAIQADAEALKNVLSWLD